MIEYTIGGPDDCESIAKLHALSWKRHYRGIMSDKYLDEDVDDERLELWTNRFDENKPEQMVIVAKLQGELCGFACHFLDYDPIHGNYLDNLHVLDEFHGKGIGKQLIKLSIAHCIQFGPKPYFLWVFEQNVKAIAFYRSLGGRPANETKLAVPPGQCSGHPALLYQWKQPENVLINTPAISTDLVL